MDLDMLLEVMQRKPISQRELMQTNVAAVEAIMELRKELAEAKAALAKAQEAK